MVPALLLMGLLTGSAPAQVKVATVDMKKIFERYWKKKAAEDQLQQLKDDMEKEEKNMESEFKTVKKEYDDATEAARDSNISPEERDKRKQVVEDKFKRMRDLQEGYQQYDRNAKSRLMEQTQRMRTKIIDEIRTVATAKAKATGFNLVLDVAAQSGDATPVVLYTSGENDLTDSILIELNRTAPVANPAADDKAAAKTNTSAGDKKK